MWHFQVRASFLGVQPARPPRSQQDSRLCSVSEWETEVVWDKAFHGASVEEQCGKKEINFIFESH